MHQTKELATWSKNQLQIEIAAIANVPKSNAEAATQAATALLASFPRVPHSNDPEAAMAYRRQLNEALVGEDLDVLRMMLDPKHGLIGKQVFPPAIAEVRKWINGRMELKRKRIGIYLEELDRIEKKASEMPIDEAERERNADRLRGVAAQIRKAAAAMQRFNFKPIQQDCRNEIAAGTDYIGIGKFHD
jgi:hypothetical protein